MFYEHSINFHFISLFKLRIKNNIKAINNCQFYYSQRKSPNSFYSIQYLLNFFYYNYKMSVLTRIIVSTNDRSTGLLTEVLSEVSPPRPCLLFLFSSQNPYPALFFLLLLIIYNIPCFLFHLVRMFATQKQGYVLHIGGQNTQ